MTPVASIKAIALSLARCTVPPAVAFINRLDKEEDVVIVHDDDPDGICSGVLISKCCMKATNRNPKVQSTEYGQSLTPKILSKLRSQHPQAIIFTDVPAIPPTLLVQAARIAPILVLDHHFPEEYQDVVYVNPRLVRAEAYLPSSCLAFYVSSGLGLSENLCWIAGIGVLADHGVENCMPLMRLIKRRFPSLLGGRALSDVPLMDEAPLGRITRIITSAGIASHSDGIATAFNALANSDSYRDILEGSSPEARRLRSWDQSVTEEFARIIADANQNISKIGSKVMLYRFSSKLRIKSIVANYLPRLYPSKIILVIQRDGAFTHVSFRRGQRNHADLRVLVQKAVEGIPSASGGGHPEASAARLPTRHLDEFLKRVNELSSTSIAN